MKRMSAVFFKNILKARKKGKRETRGLPYFRRHQGRNANGVMMKKRTKVAYKINIEKR